MSLVAVGSGVNNHILTAQGSPHLTRPGSPTHSQLRRALEVGLINRAAQLIGGG